MIDLRVLAVLGLLVLTALVVSGIAPYDRATWLMEVGPVLIGAPLLLATYRRFPLTMLAKRVLRARRVVGRAGAGRGRRRVPRHPG